MNDYLTEDDRERIRKVVQSIVNEKVIKELTSILDQQRTEERFTKNILLVVVGLFVIIVITMIAI